MQRFPSGPTDEAAANETPADETAADEARRLEVLETYDIVGVALGPLFHDLLGLAQKVFDTPMSLLSIVAADRLTYAAAIGLEGTEVKREGTFCTQAIRGREALVVTDASADPRFATNEFVVASPNLRFYAAAPLVAPGGVALGALCVLDTVPHHDVSRRQTEALEALARLAMERLESRRQALRREDLRKGFEAITALSPDAIICADGQNRILTWNDAAETIFGYAADEVIGRRLSQVVVPPALRARHEAAFARATAGAAHGPAGPLLRVPALRRDGTEFPVELSLTHWIEGGEHRFGAIVRDVTDRVRAEDRLRREASLDHLTGLANRKTLAAALEMAAGRDGGAAVLLLLDLDGFKDVNDSLGHVAGDEVLRVVARRLGEGAAEAGLVSRLGGDEFAVLLAPGSDADVALLLGYRLIAAIEQPIEVGERCVYVGASGGVAVAEGEGWEPEGLLAEADLALYRAKADRRSGVRLFTPELRAVERTRNSVSSGLREAWERREFELYYQPQVRLGDRAMTGAEALIRWNHPERGLLGPAAFLSALETSLLVGPVATWILRAACEQARRCRDLGLPDFSVAVNLFSTQFRSGDLPRVVEEALGASGLPADALELELTENTLLQNDGRMAAQLVELRGMGVGIAFDDYGTGFASLTMLKACPATRLKIDRSFVRDVSQSRADQAIVEAIGQLARSVDLEVVAEGIETEEQAALMRPHSRYGQGYLFGRPMPAAALEAECRAAVRASRARPAA